MLLLSGSSTAAAAVAADGRDATTSSSGVAAPIVFEPIMPSTETLLGMGFIVTLCIIVAYVWQTQVVPTSRTNLALSKRNGPVKDYLDDLKKAAATTEAVTESSSNTTTTINNSNMMELDAVLLRVDTVRNSTLEQQETENDVMATTTTANNNNNNNTEKQLQEDNVVPNSSSASSSSSRDFERWLFTDWLQDNNNAKSAAPRKKQPGRQKPAALPILKDAKWNSGDNPVLAATLLISVGVVLTAVTEKVSQVVFDIIMKTV
jgi:hypothetical protein